MKILAVDIGTGTQDIFLYDSRLDIENSFKLVLPSPTMMVHRRIHNATQNRAAILLTGVTMGGGPSAWAAQAHAHAGYPVYATPEAARTMDDDLKKVIEMGIQIVSEDEAQKLPKSVLRLQFQDFNFIIIVKAFEAFDISLHDLAAVAIAVFDHGAAPPGVSDRQFRFDYLDARIREQNRLSAFAYISDEIPASMTRLQAVATSAASLDCPTIVMDTSPAAILGTTFDPLVAIRKRKLVANIGNFHTLAFRLGPEGIEGVFEHHTGFLDHRKLENLLRSLADGSLRHQEVFDDHGHGALVYSTIPLPLGKDDYDVVVTGPRRSIFKSFYSTQPQQETLKPYFATPFGDMMLAGCFGLLSATADLLPALSESIRKSLSNTAESGSAPWDLVD